MVRPYWMASGKLTEGGVPSSLLEGHKNGNRHNRLLFQKKQADRKQRLEEQQQMCFNLGVRRLLTREQKICGARYVG